MTVPRRWLSLGVLSLAMLVVGLDTTVLNVALPTLATELGASTSELQWFANAYLLAMATLLLPGGLLGDRAGRKPTTIASLAVFGLGSLWSATAGSPGELIAARAVMGVGGALLAPLAFSWVIALFGPDERARAMGALGGASFLGLPLGPVVAGWLLDRYAWGSVFAINVPLIAVAAALGLALLPKGGAQEAARHVDAVGIALSLVGLAGLTYGLIQAPVDGWTDPTVLVTGLGGLAVLVGFVAWEARQREPLLDTRLWRLPAFGWGAGAVAVATLLGMVTLFSVPLYLQGVLGVDALGSGLRLLPLLGGLVLGIGGGVAVAARLGARAAFAAGFGLLAVGAALAARTAVSSPYGFVAAWLAVVGAGFGCALISGQNTALEALSPERAGVGGALVQVMRQVGGVVGVAALVSVLNAVYRARVDVTALPRPVADAVRDSVQAGLAAAGQLGDPALAASVQAAFVDGLRSQMWIAAAVAALGLVATVAAMPRRFPAEPVATLADVPLTPGSNAP